MSLLLCVKVQKIDRQMEKVEQVHFLMIHFPKSVAKMKPEIYLYRGCCRIKYTFQKLSINFAVPSVMIGFYCAHLITRPPLSFGTSICGGVHVHIFQIIISKRHIVSSEISLYFVPLLYARYSLFLFSLHFSCDDAMPVQNPCLHLCCCGNCGSQKL